MGGSKGWSRGEEDKGWDAGGGSLGLKQDWVEKHSLTLP